MKDKPSYTKQEKVYCEGYEKNQYEDQDLEYFPIGGIEARYIRQEDPEYQDNLLAEGLPPEAEKTEDVVDILTEVPYYSMEERKKSPLYRIRAVGRLLDFHFVRPEDVEVYRDIHRFLRLSCREKNIDLRGNYEKTIELGNMAKKLKGSLLEGNRTIIKQGAGQVLGKLIIGVSGGGKSTGTELTLKHIPQVLVHPNTSEKYIQHEQITWLKVECSPTGSIKGMCMKIIGEIDRILGKNYSARVNGGRVNVDILMMEIKHLSILHSIGVLVIDEIQHLKVTKDNEQMLNFFLTLSNEINLPIIYIGTQEAVQKVFSKNHRYARRVEGDGDIEYGFLTREDFDDFLTELWNYQWTKYETELTDEIKDLMYLNTIGIPARIIKVFSRAQVNAIMDGSEKVDVRQIKKAINSFPIGKEMIAAFLRNDVLTLQKLQDITPLAVDIKGIINEGISALETESDIRRYQEEKLHIKALGKKKLNNELIVQFSAYGYDPQSTRQVIDKVLNKFYGKKENRELYRMIATELLKLDSKDGANDTKGE